MPRGSRARKPKRRRPSLGPAPEASPGWRRKAAYALKSPPLRHRPVLARKPRTAVQSAYVVTTPAGYVLQSRAPMAQAITTNFTPTTAAPRPLRPAASQSTQEIGTCSAIAAGSNASDNTAAATRITARVDPKLASSRSASGSSTKGRRCKPASPPARSMAASLT